MWRHCSEHNEHLRFWYGVSMHGISSLTWWRHQMETFSALLAICAGNSPVTGEFPTQRPVTRSFDVFFDLRLNKRLSKQSWGWWFETSSCPLWRQCNGGERNDPHNLCLSSHSIKHKLFNSSLHHLHHPTTPHPTDTPTPTPTPPYPIIHTHTTLSTPHTHPSTPTPTPTLIYLLL